MKLISTISVLIFMFVSLSNQFQELSAKSASLSSLRDRDSISGVDVAPSKLGQHRDFIGNFDNLMARSTGSHVKRSVTTSVGGDLNGTKNKVQAGQTKSAARSGQSGKNIEKAEKFEIIKKRIIITINNLLTHESRIVDEFVEGESKAEFLELKELVDQLALDFVELSPLLKVEFFDGPVIILRDFIGVLLKPLIAIDKIAEPYEGKIIEFLKRYIPGVKIILPLIASIIPSIQTSFNEAVGGQYPALVSASASTQALTSASASASKSVL